MHRNERKGYDHDHDAMGGGPASIEGRLSKVPLDSQQLIEVGNTFTSMSRTRFESSAKSGRRW
jgi:hypothetical protein